MTALWSNGWCVLLRAVLCAFYTVSAVVAYCDFLHQIAHLEALAALTTGVSVLFSRQFWFWAPLVGRTMIGEL